MLDYSMAAFKKIKNDFLRIKRVFDIIIPLFPIAFLTYSVITQTGIFWANVISLALAVAYYIFHVIVTFRSGNKDLKKTVKTLYKICVRVIKFLTLAISLYGLWVSMENVNPLSMLLTISSLVGWLLQVTLDIILHIINSYATFLKEAIMADVEELKKPITKVNNFFRKMTGKEVEEPEVSPVREKLDRLVEEHREEKKEQKRQKREQKRQDRQEKKQSPREEEAAATDAPPSDGADGKKEKPKIFGFFNRFKK